MELALRGLILIERRGLPTSAWPDARYRL